MTANEHNENELSDLLFDIENIVATLLQRNSSNFSWFDLWTYTWVEQSNQKAFLIELKNKCQELIDEIKSLHVQNFESLNLNGIKEIMKSWHSKLSLFYRDFLTEITNLLISSGTGNQH